MFDTMIEKIFAFLHFLRKIFWKKLGRPTFGVRGMLIDDGKILLVQHRYNNLWVMPGGKIDGTDSPELALIKEFK